MEAVQIPARQRPLTQPPPLVLMGLRRQAICQNFFQDVHLPNHMFTFPNIAPTSFTGLMQSVQLRNTKLKTPFKNILWKPVIGPVL